LDYISYRRHFSIYRKEDVLFQPKIRGASEKYKNQPRPLLRPRSVNFHQHFRNLSRKTVIHNVDQVYTVRTVAADLRQGEHIPKMQNDVGRKSTLQVLRQPRSKGGGGGGGLAAMPCRAVTCPAARRSAQRWILQSCRGFTLD
jgi:hypothetical protein